MPVYGVRDGRVSGIVFEKEVDVVGDLLEVLGAVFAQFGAAQTDHILNGADRRSLGDDDELNGFFGAVGARARVGNRLAYLFQSVR